MRSSDLAVTRQDELGRKLAEVREMTITHTFCDNDISAAGKVERPDFERLLEVIEAGLVRAVIAQAMDRLARNQSDGVRLLKACVRRGVKLVFISGGDIELDTPMGQFVASMMILIAELEVGIKGQRQKIANRQRAVLGKVRVCAPRPFGWLSDRVTPHPVEGPAVESAYLNVLAGGTRRSIASLWNNTEGLAPPQGAKAWTTKTVRAVLLNPRHCGKTSIGGELLGDVEAGTRLIDPETWEAVRTILTETDRKSVPLGVKSLVGGIATCCCHQGKVTLAKNVRGQASYRHQRPAGFDDGGAKHVSRRAEPVDDFIERSVVARLSRPDAIELLRRVGDGQDIEELRKRRKALLDKADEIALAYDDPDSPWTDRQLEARSRKNKAEVAEVEAALTDARQVQVFGAYGELIGAEDVRAAWMSLHVDRKRLIIQALFSDITLFSPGMGKRPKPVQETVRLTWR